MWQKLLQTIKQVRVQLSDLSNNSTELMDHLHGHGANELYQAQAHIFKHIFNFISSMSLKCAAQLGIPDIIQSHNQPITLQELVSKLQIPLEKASCLHRLMRILVHSGFFAKVNQNQQEGYVLTLSSKLLLKDHKADPSLLPYVLAILDPALVTPFHFLGEWFKKNEASPFESAHGLGLWEFCGQTPEISDLFNEAMSSDCMLMKSVIMDCKPVFEGLSSLVDVGGGTGMAAMIISEAFPDMRCTVFDLPHVVANLQGSMNVKYVGGDMFVDIPSADAILIKCVLHDWSDEDCVKIMKKCKEAIPSRDGGGKVMIIEMVVNDDKGEEKQEETETKLYFDILMMVLVHGRERNEKEWEKIFLDAGFSHYKITPMFGLRSLIEVFP